MKIMKFMLQDLTYSDKISICILLFISILVPIPLLTFFLIFIGFLKYRECGDFIHIIKTRKKTIITCCISIIASFSVYVFEYYGNYIEYKNYISESKFISEYENLEKKLTADVDIEKKIVYLNAKDDEIIKKLIDSSLMTYFENDPYRIKEYLTEVKNHAEGIIKNRNSSYKYDEKECWHDSSDYTYSVFDDTSFKARTLYQYLYENCLPSDFIKNNILSSINKSLVSLESDNLTYLYDKKERELNIFGEKYPQYYPLSTLRMVVKEIPFYKFDSFYFGIAASIVNILYFICFHFLFFNILSKKNNSCNSRH
jgi:hypothetical protein